MTVCDIPPLRTAKDLINAVNSLGVLPFFKNNVPGFSVAEHTPREIWFVEGVEGPWEWKGETVRAGLMYAKLFRGKAVWVSRGLVPHLLNWRRDGYDYDSLYDEGLLPAAEKHIMDVLTAEGPLLSTQLKELSGYGRNGKKGFDGLITRLQMRGYAAVSDFEYALDKHGSPYGWGVARYAAPEQIFGAGYVRSAYSVPPAESKQIIVDQLQKILPQTGADAILRLIRE